MVPKLHFKWCWANNALSIWPSQVFKEIKNFWDVSTVRMPVSQAQLWDGFSLVCSHTCPQQWVWHRGELQKHSLSKYKKKMNWACQHLLSEPHALHLLFYLTLSICHIKGSCRNLIKRGICRVKMMTFCKVISSPETIMLIKVLYLDHLQTLSMDLKKSQHHGGSRQSSIHIPNAFSSTSHKMWHL